ncbi:hypothetical protein DYB31_002390 [Aphanomyces astaci]|uniref:Phosphoglycerate mutase n=1 Tax=Aphanomyces astaci TaxID=112090 RepID=A0A397ETW0_APHAT|nr:hypothetical protein DYB31_002390 [Aphanomyces astaci]
MASPSPSADKTIHFIRHGESTFNQWRLRSILTFSWIFVKDPMIIDARLSAQGKLQLAHEFGSAGIDTTSLADYWWLSYPTAATMTIPQSAEEVAPLRESVADLDARILAFLHLLRDLPQTNIAVVGHSSFIKRLTKATRKLANCEIHTTTLHQCLK